MKNYSIAAMCVVAVFSGVLLTGCGGGGGVSGTSIIANGARSGSVADQTSSDIDTPPAPPTSATSGDGSVDTPPAPPSSADLDYPPHPPRAVDRTPE